MEKGELTFCSVFVSISVGLVVYSLWAIFYAEIDTNKYTRVHYWSKHLPEVRLMVETATWEDDKIDKFEFREIEKVATKLLLQDARGDNEQ